VSDIIVAEASKPREIRKGNNISDMVKHRIFTRVIICIFLGLSLGYSSGRREADPVAQRRRFLDRIVVPIVEFDDSTLQHAVDFAWSRAVELDQPQRRGVSISIRFPSGAVYPRRNRRKFDRQERTDEIVFSLHAVKITLTELLVQIARRSRFDLYTTSAGVVFCPPGSPPFPNFYAKNGEVWEKLFTVPKK
jgi:hypothetical protein